MFSCSHKQETSGKDIHLLIVNSYLQGVRFGVHLEWDALKMESETIYIFKNTVFLGVYHAIQSLGI